ncbi:MAG: hypothetical protein CFE43_11690 [Burkholderiales bacterium PBB3]|nr:MAG: hypothetical protein CFE43_11690 [Burkholderiales bacterium PBB3]
MNEYILFMCNDASDPIAANDGVQWGEYITTLRQSGCFDGGSSIGAGERVRKGQASEPASADWTGFIRVRAESLEDAKRLLVGNPTYEAGGTVEVRELLRD